MVEKRNPQGPVRARSRQLAPAVERLTSLPQVHLRFGAPVNFKRSHVPPVSPRFNVAATMTTQGKPTRRVELCHAMTDRPRRHGGLCGAKSAARQPSVQG